MKLITKLAKFTTVHGVVYINPDTVCTVKPNVLIDPCIGTRKTCTRIQMVSPDIYEDVIESEDYVIKALKYGN